MKTPVLLFAAYLPRSTPTQPNPPHPAQPFCIDLKLLFINKPRSIYQYSNMNPRLSGQNCKFLKFLLSHNSQKKLGNKENNTKYRSLSRKPHSHVRILIYRMWPITSFIVHSTKLLNFDWSRAVQLIPNCTP